MFSKKQKLFLTGLFVILLIAVLSAVFYIGDQKALKKDIAWGITFSAPYAEGLGLDSRQVYLKILDDLRVDNIRLPIYWNRLEKERGVFDFSELDWQIKEAAKYGAEISLVIGRRVPRWPECWEPAWAKNLEAQEMEKRLLNLLGMVVQHYQNEPVIKYWQIENEPLLDAFGKCPPGDLDLLKKEIALVKSLDQRPIIITESGELSSWRQGDDLADILGVSMYRVVWNKYIGYFKWFAPPAFYRLKARLIDRTGDDIFNTELQAEPWAPSGAVEETPLEEQYKSMSLEQFKKNINFARRTGFSKVYLWGAEWWYWLKENKGVNIFWREAGELWRS